MFHLLEKCDSRLYFVDEKKGMPLVESRTKKEKEEARFICF
jgi:hypothetical protein